MPFAQCNGITLYYEVRGQGEPLVMIAGQQMDHTFWKFTRDSYAKYFRTISYDHRGTGLSDAPSSPPYSMEVFAADVVALLDHLGITRAHFFGVSMGGRIIQRLALSYPIRVGSIIIGASTPGNKHGIRRRADVDDLLNGRSAHSNLKQAIQDLMVSREFVAANPEYVMSMSRPPIPTHAVALHFAASEGHEAWDELPKICSPTLLLHGDNDDINPSANSILLAQRIPNATLVWIQGARHGFHSEYRDVTVEAVRDFLAKYPLHRARL